MILPYSIKQWSNCENDLVDYLPRTAKYPFVLRGMQSLAARELGCLALLVFLYQIDSTAAFICAVGGIPNWKHAAEQGVLSIGPSVPAKGCCHDRLSSLPWGKVPRVSYCRHLQACNVPVEGNGALEHIKSQACGASVVGSATTEEATGTMNLRATGEGGGTIPPVIGDIRRLSTETLCVRPRLTPEHTHIAPHGHFVELFRACTPYIRAHQGATMVVHIGGEIVENASFLTLMDDLGLLCLLGVRLALVTGARPQISSMLRQAGVDEEFRHGIRITSPEALKLIKAAAGYVRIEVESALTRGGRGSGCCKVSGGNYFSAQPIGVKDGIDFKCTGNVRRVEVDKIRAQLDEGDIVQLTCMGYSSSGEVFNVDSRDLAARCASALGAQKLIYIDERAQLEDTATGEVIQSLRLSEARSLISHYKSQAPINASSARMGSAVVGIDNKQEGQASLSPWNEDAGWGDQHHDHDWLEEDFMTLIEKGVDVLTKGVPRVHIVPPSCGALLQELYTRDGAGLLISRDIYDGIRLATSGDIPGITEIITPLERSGILVHRPREQLEADILRNEFFVITRDDAVLGVAFFKRYGQDHAEVGCLAIHQGYRKRGWGEALLSYLERVAIASSVKHLFVLSTRTMQWFVERGFKEADVPDLPEERISSYNWERRSKIYTKTLGGGTRSVDAEEMLWDVRGVV